MLTALMDCIQDIVVLPKPPPRLKYNDMEASLTRSSEQFEIKYPWFNRLRTGLQ